MNSAGITLIIVGVIFLIGSFFIKDKLSHKDIEQIADLSQEELKIIVEKQLKNAKDKVEAMIDESLEDSKDAIKRSMEKESNEKVMAISDYSDTVLESMNKTHNEIMFLYSMLNDKHKDLTELAGQLQDFSKEMKNVENDTMNRLSDAASELEQKVAAAVPMDEQEMLETTVEEVSEQDSLTNHNEHIMILHRVGKSDVEIAKELGLGLGEVKLVIGLYKGEKKNAI